ncbi:MAG: DEAD/DEAH box helicase [Actinomycetota bacterium]
MGSPAVTLLERPPQDSSARGRPVVHQPTLDDGLSAAVFAPSERPTFDLDVDLVPGVGFHPAVARWFRGRFGRPTPPQADGWPTIADGRHTLIAAPTGSGKTLAGFLMAINRLYLDHVGGCGPAGTDVVYVSPLKALAVDIAENLQRPLAEIAETATSMGLTHPDLTIGVRTGDTPPAERQAMMRRPRSFVVTTPESLYLLVTAAKGRRVLAAVRTVIVDEIHAMARDKRGSHLSITLERLEHLCLANGSPAPTRIGLSATQRPIETVARLLVGTRTASAAGRGCVGRPEGEWPAACAVVDGGHARHLDLGLELPDGELEAVASGTQLDGMLDRIAELVTQHRTTLVFVNTRRLAERLAHQLGERLGDDDTGSPVVAAHHGSLSKDRRHLVERRLRAGELRALVATASLELGIDVGPVELVCQIGSPRSIATFLQRVGRSNHTRHGTPRGRLFPLTRDELVECAALLTAVRAGRLDAVNPPEAPLDILAQQLVAETGADEWDADDLYRLVTRAHPYRDLARRDFDRVVDLVCDGILTGRGRRAAWVHRDEENGELRGRRGARYVALTSGGAIPEIYDMRVVVEPDEAFIGTVTEDWAMESSAGDIFLLGTNSWRIRQVTGGEVRVTDAGDAPPTVPFWAGEAPARTTELSEEVSRLRRLVDRHLDRNEPAGAIDSLIDSSGIPEAAASTIVAYLTAGRATLGRLPTSTTLVMERFFDDADGTQLVIHSPLGARINRAMGYALRKKFCVGFNFELQAAASDDAVVISLGPHHSFPLTDVVRFLTPATITETLTQAVLDQPAFQSRWRWNLNRSLIVLRMRNGRRNPPPIQRMESDDLLAALFPDAAACQENVSGPIRIPEHPVVDQTIHDTLTEGLDVDGLIELWQRFDAGDAEMVCVETTEPSVLAHEILTARPYAFLDDDEIPDRRTRAVALRRGLPVEPTELGALLPEAIEQVRSECRPDPRTADELHDLLVDAVVLRPCERWQPLYDQLSARGRACAIELAEGTPRWIATGSTVAAQVLVGGRPIDDLFPEQVAARALRGHLDLCSPTTVDDLAEATGLRRTLISVGLAALESEGFAIQGHFTEARSACGTAPGRTPAIVEWCSRRLLARMHHRSRSGRRRSVEAVTPETFVRFLARWQRVAPGTQLVGRHGVEEAIGQLQGWAAGAAAWEPELLVRRLDTYDPSWLDRLCVDGHLRWLRLRPPERVDDERRGVGASRVTPISLVHRQDLPWLLDAWRGPGDPVPPSTGPLAEVVAVLASTGPRFAADLAADTGRLPTDIEAALWDGVARGLLSADGFGAIRSLTERSARRHRHQRSLSRLRRADRGTIRSAGRWSLVSRPSTPTDDSTRAIAEDGTDIGTDGPGGSRGASDELAEAVADQLLQRWGVVCYELAAVERLRLPWRDLQWALRRFEDRGLVRGGRFVKGVSGEQFALPEAAELLVETGRQPAVGTVEVCGLDPLNLTGVLLPGPRIPARRGTRVQLPC